MTEEQEQLQPKRYTYKLRLEHRGPKKDEESEFSPEELQAYISEILRSKTEN
ncbi:MAG: hypothetical protein OK438_00455 [Thaumarchaeota archaeon]|nr:hypothetical protein [Nitrososphaerota archaeon]